VSPSRVLPCRAGDLGIPMSEKRVFYELPAQPPLFAGGTWHDYQREGINFLRNSW
jgi:hypothetical protein